MDSRIGKSHLMPVHASGVSVNTGRGAGGHCFIKDFEALLQVYKNIVGDQMGVDVLESLRDKNNELLRSTKKDLNLLDNVYGKSN